MNWYESQTNINLDLNLLSIENKYNAHIIKRLLRKKIDFSAVLHGEKFEIEMIVVIKFKKRDFKNKCKYLK